jgi:2-polyprenyl-3-methyl-5-hydroxy-6-metoxy-1,4-benzoquinol methylase
VLNLGFGSADLENIVFNKLKKNKLKWKGIDISKYSVGFGKSEFPKLYFEQNDVRKMKIMKSKYNYIIALELLEHIQTKYTFKVLHTIYNNLKNKGFFVLSIPLNEGLEDMIKMGVNPNAHVRLLCF